MSASAADVAIVEAAAAEGIVVSVRQLRQYRSSGLLPRNERSWPGGGGSRSEPHKDAVAHLRVLDAVLQRGAPREAGVLALFDAGLTVEFELVRAAVRRVVDDYEALLVEHAPPSASPADVEALAERLASGGHRFAVEARARARVVWPAVQVRAVVTSAFAGLVSLLVGGRGPSDRAAEVELLEVLGGLGAGREHLDMLEAVDLEVIGELVASMSSDDLRWAANTLRDLRVVGRAVDHVGADAIPGGAAYVVFAGFAFPRFGWRDGAAGWLLLLAMRHRLDGRPGIRAAAEVRADLEGGPLADQVAAGLRWAPRR